MKRKRAHSKSSITFLNVAILLGLAYAGAAAAQGQYGPIVSVNPATDYWFNEQHGDGMVGWVFNLQQPVTVNQVGWYDDGQDGLSRSFQIGLWQDLTGSADSILVYCHFQTSNPYSIIGDPDEGITIPAGTTASLNGAYRVVNLPWPITLAPGNYELGGLDSASTADPIRYLYGRHETPVPGMTQGPFFYADPLFRNSAFGPTESLYLADGLEMGPMLFATVPEPSMLCLLMIAGSILVLHRYRMIARHISLWIVALLLVVAGISAPAQTQTNIIAAQAPTGLGSDPIVVKLKNAPLSLVLQGLSDAAGYIINSDLGSGLSPTRLRRNTITLSKDSASKQELADLLLSVLLRAGVMWEINGRILTLTSMAEAQTDDRASGISSRNRTGSGVTTNQIGDYFSLVGVLDYKQGIYPGMGGPQVFFDSNNSDCVRRLRVNDTIARVYKVTKIDTAAGTVTLTSGAGSAEMKVGTQMRWYGSGSWDGPFEGTGSY
jgi:hypothetical protein